MTLVVKKEQLKAEKLNDEIYDFLIQYQTMIEQFETFKFKLKEVMEKTNTEKWDNEIFVAFRGKAYVKKSADTDKMKKTSIYIPDGETGELVKVNAYDYFIKSTYVSPSFSIKFKEDK